MPHMSSRPLDTTPEAWAQHAAVLERMGGDARLLTALELSDAGLEGLRARHPEASHGDLIRRLVREEYGIELPERW